MSIGEYKNALSAMLCDMRGVFQRMLLSYCHVAHALISWPVLIDLD